MKKIKDHIKELRIDFTSDTLDEKDVSKSPFVQFEKWLMQAIDANVNEPNAMTLATSSKNGQVDARIVLLRDFSPKGFSFFSNYNSIKGQEIRLNKKGCLNFFWPELQRQVRIRGNIVKLSPITSDRYFASRPRESQLSAWASHQSEPLTDRNELEERFWELEKKFDGKKIHRPPHWGGYCINPIYIEFWQGRSNRLHDRVIYQKGKTGKWTVGRLNP